MMALGDTLMTLSLSEAERLPLWRRPVALLALMAFAMPIAFATWSALLNNFVIEVAGFDGADIGWLHTVREIPGFFAIGVILLILFIREQVLAIVSLILLGAATAITAQFPTPRRALVRDAPEFHRLSLLRDGEPVAAASVAGQEEGAANARLASSRWDRARRSWPIC
jgi:MFS family permease